MAEPATDKALDRVDPGQLESGPSPEPTIAPDELRTFTLVATGELLVHEFVADTAALYGGDEFDFSPMFRRVRPILAGADLALCHLETPLSPDNSKFEFYPLFLVPFQLATAIGGAGYDGCSVASNHLLDYGESGVVATLDHLAAAGVAASGAASDPTLRGWSTTLRGRGSWPTRITPWPTEPNSLWSASTSRNRSTRPG